MKLPETADKSLYFPVVQECESGVNRWIEIPTGAQKRDERREPAPVIRLMPKAQ